MNARIPVRAVFRFGTFEFDPDTGELRKQGMKIRLQGQPVRILKLLLERPGELITRQELQEKLWPADTFVDFEQGLNNAVKRLRAALDDNSDTPRFIETLPRRGYRFIGSPRESAMVTPATEPARGRRWLAALLSSAGILGIIVAVALLRGPVRVKPGKLRAIAVLPLQNTTGNKEFDFLRVGLADDIATTLSYQPIWSIRPYSTINKYAGPDVDIQKAAKEMRVADVITGHFLAIGDSIEVTIEAVDPADNRVLWRDTIQGPARDLAGLQRQLAARVQHGLPAALGLSLGLSKLSGVSHNAEAYELYLRALALVDQPLSHSVSFSANVKNAIQMLERAVAIEPAYSSAWATLGHFYYYDESFGNEGAESKLRAKAALQRAVALDPRRIDAASDLINIESEEGRLNESYDDITRLLRERPESGAAHLVYAYVLWYAGLLDEAAHECETTRSIDAGTTDLASCGYVFLALGYYDRAEAFFQLQSGTEYETAGQVEILLREGKQDEALSKLRSLPSSDFYGKSLLAPCLQHTSARNTDIQKVRSGLMSADDPFPKYLLGAWDSFCGEPVFAYRELRGAIDQHYCAYSQIEKDPLLAPIRARPEFAELRSLSLACQQHFLDHRKQVAH